MTGCLGSIPIAVRDGGRVNRWWRAAPLTVFVVVTLGIVGLAMAISAAEHGWTTSTASVTATPPVPAEPALTFAVIGDIPYTPAQLAALPGWVDQINADPKVAFTVHVGDIKAGSSPCTNDYFRTVRGIFDRFRGPLIFTPGDNEWTDCHRTPAGEFDPLERLAALRSIFFTTAGRTLGSAPLQVASLSALGMPEIVSWRSTGVSFAALHVVGSDDGLRPWSGRGERTVTAAQRAEQTARSAAVRALVDTTIDSAAQANDRAVVFFLQADMFAAGEEEATDLTAYRPLVQTLAAAAGRYSGPIYLVNGGSHTFAHTRPLESGSEWLPAYGVDLPAPSIIRVAVDGSDRATGWLRLSLPAEDPAAAPALTPLGVAGGLRDPLAITQVPFRSVATATLASTGPPSSSGG